MNLSKMTTRSKKRVRIYAQDHRGEFPIVGAIEWSDGWSDADWTAKGKYLGDDEKQHELDLV